jgi:hypothetical protein
MQLPTLLCWRSLTAPGGCILLNWCCGMHDIEVPILIRCEPAVLAVSAALGLFPAHMVQWLPVWAAFMAAAGSHAGKRALFCMFFSASSA